MYDMLGPKGCDRRRIHGYLLKEAVVCVDEERRHTTCRLVQSVTRAGSLNSPDDTDGRDRTQSRGVLWLKGLSSVATSHSGMRGSMLGPPGSGATPHPGPSSHLHGKPPTPLDEDEELIKNDSANVFVTPHVAVGPSNTLPLPLYAPLGLILVVSVPPPRMACDGGAQDWRGQEHV
jgi:hypothetical protein